VVADFSARSVSPLEADLFDVEFDLFLVEAELLFVEGIASLLHHCRIGVDAHQ
jgi:hypothetical protein